MYINKSPKQTVVGNNDNRSLIDSVSIALHSETETDNGSSPRNIGKLVYSYLCTYDLYGPVRNFFDAFRSITRASRMRLGP